jgi:hypothetical protein
MLRVSEGERSMNGAGDTDIWETLRHLMIAPFSGKQRLGQVATTDEGFYRCVESIDNLSWIMVDLLLHYDVPKDQHPRMAL